MLKYEMDSAYPCRSVPCQIATGILFLEWGTEENNETHLSSGSRNSIRSCSEKKSGVIAWDNLLCSFFIVYALIFSSSHSGASFLLCLCPFSFAPLIFKCFFFASPLACYNFLLYASTHKKIVRISYNDSVRITLRALFFE